MCGIAGFLNFDGKPAASSTVKGMTDILAHRGPDGEGQWVENNVGIGHRRLAILDLSSAGNQPMAYADGRYILTYNGEIYNFKELRRELESHSFVFRTQTDSEVVVAAYAHWGEAAVAKFNGMFAFAIWDRKEKELFLARDRYGIKPIYYANTAEAFIFASENKAFEAVPGFKRDIDIHGLVEYLTFQNFLTSKTLFKSVEMFPAGYYGKIKYGKRQLELNQYWDFNFSNPKHKVLTENEYLEELDFLFKQAVNRQLLSDVEIGSYLSGGMDSGAITALAAKELPYIKTFTVGFDLSSASGLELGYDERAKAEYMSYLFKTEHYEMVLKSGDMERALPSLARALEEPRVGQSYPNYYAAKLASKFTKVVLSGCGGDEIFGGYPWRYYRSLGHSSFDNYVESYYSYWQRLLNEDQLKKVLAPVWDEASRVDTRELFRNVYRNHKNSLETPEDYVNHSLYFEAKTFLHGLLVVDDKLSMAHSLESRVPFLDNSLVDFVQEIPLGLKLNNLSSSHRINENDPEKKTDKYFDVTKDGKLIFRKMMERYIPKQVTDRAKQGFSAPDASWFKGESLAYANTLLFKEDSAISKFMDMPIVKSHYADHVSGEKNNRLLIWSLLNLENLLKGLS